MVSGRPGEDGRMGWKSQAGRDARFFNDEECEWNLPV